MLSLLLRLEVALVEPHADGAPRAPGDAAAFRSVARLLWRHSNDLIGGTRESEIENLAGEATEDPLAGAVVALQRFQEGARRRGGPDVAWAAADAGRLVEARGVRLSLEASGVPRSQFAVLRILSTWLLLGFCYLTIVRDGSGSGLDFSLFGFVERAGGGQTFDATVGARALFALVVGALDVFNSLADDLNDPFRGQFTLESTTVSASLQQLRARIRAAVREEAPRPPEA